eukprot:Skav235053  [mRNA]  locus=scaffold3697:96691:100430:+ [translate_table: standard]
MTDAAILHFRSLWRAIVNAKGFPPTFPQWWTHRSIIHPDDPPFVPLLPPEAAVIANMRRTIEEHVRQLEKMQQRALKKHMQMEYQRNQNKVYKDVQAARPAPVESLVNTCQMKVLEVVDEGSVLVESVEPFREDWPIEGDQYPLFIEVKSDGYRVPLCQADSDLWEVVALLIADNEHRVQCVHVHSHQRLEGLSEAEAWVCKGNDAADRAAAWALTALPPEVLSAQATASASHRLNITCYADVVKHFVRVGHQSVANPEVLPVPVEPTPAQAKVLVHHEALHPSAIVECVSDKVPAYMRFSELNQWLSWFRQLENPASQVRLVSWIELAIHFQLTTGCVGMFCNKGKTGNQRVWQSYHRHASVNMATVAKSFSQFGWNMLRLWNADWKSIRAKPQLHYVQYWTACIPLKVGQAFEDAVIDHFRAAKVGVLTSARDLAKLPVAMPA